MKTDITQVTQAKRRRSGQRLDDHQRAATQDAFLIAFARDGVVRSAAAEAGVTRQMVYEWRNTDPGFKARYELAEHDANDVIDAEIQRRGVMGWDETTVTETRDDHGQLVKTESKTVNRKSDTLLALLAKSRMPRYRDRVDVTSNDEALGAHGSITQIIADPITAGLVCDVLQRIGRDAPAESDARGTGDSGE